jgi:hypothetical protein
MPQCILRDGKFAWQSSTAEHVSEANKEFSGLDVCVGVAGHLSLSSARRGRSSVCGKERVRDVALDLVERHESAQRPFWRFQPWVETAFFALVPVCGQFTRVVE